MVGRRRGLAAVQRVRQIVRPVHATAIAGGGGRASYYRISVQDLLFGSGEGHSRAAVVGRALLLLGLVVSGWRLARLPLGRFMSVLGGSLMQLLIPAVCAGTLLLQTRDPFGAACCLWWIGENLLDLAPYIADARA